MYKHAHGAPSKPNRHPLQWAPGSYWRQYYFNAIHEDFRLGRKFSAVFHKDAPAWLVAEVAKEGAAKWLARWGRKKLKNGLPQPRITTKRLVAKPPRAYFRTVYYGAIKNELAQFRKRSGRDAPKWLVAEVEAYTPLRWLQRWDKNTGKRNY